MEGNDITLRTPRLRLRVWRESDRDAFAALNSDPEVMADLGGPLSRAQSDRKLERFSSSFAQRGLGRFVIESHEGAFLGYSGVMPVREGHPLNPNHEIGWRLMRQAWGQGYASEAAQAALHDAFTRIGLREVLAYTAPNNLRSQAVMKRLNLRRDPARDFTEMEDGFVKWRGLVWVARPDR